MRKRHSIDILFSLSLFTVFVICAFLVLLFQTGSYRSIIAQGEQTERQHTSLAYVRAKIRSAEMGIVRRTHVRKQTSLDRHQDVQTCKRDGYAGMRAGYFPRFSSARFLERA